MNKIIIILAALIAGCAQDNQGKDNYGCVAKCFYTCEGFVPNPDECGEICLDEAPLVKMDTPECSSYIQEEWYGEESLIDCYCATAPIEDLMPEHQQQCQEIIDEDYYGNADVLHDLCFRW